MLSALTWTPWPIYASVLVVITFTEPPTLTATLPDPPPLTPAVAIESILVAVTATPDIATVLGVTVRVAGELADDRARQRRRTANVGRGDRVRRHDTVLRAGRHRGIQGDRDSVFGVRLGSRQLEARRAGDNRVIHHAVLEAANAPVVGHLGVVVAVVVHHRLAGRQAVVVAQVDRLVVAFDGCRRGECCAGRGGVKGAGVNHHSGLIGQRRDMRVRANVCLRGLVDDRHAGGSADAGRTGEGQIARDDRQVGLLVGRHHQAPPSGDRRGVGWV